MVQQFADNVNRKSYQQAAVYAEKIKNAYLNVLHDPAGWSAYIAQVRATNVRRRSMLDEFRHL
jgi:uncharacterized Zn finger protein